MTVRFVYNKACEPLLNRTREMQNAMAVRAEMVADAAKARAPVGAIPHVFRSGAVEPPGAYRDSIRVDVGVSKQGMVMARVNAWNWKAHWIEWGTGPPYPTQKFAPLRRGAEAVGFRLSGGVQALQLRSLRGKK